MMKRFHIIPVILVLLLAGPALAQDAPKEPEGEPTQPEEPEEPLAQPEEPEEPLAQPEDKPIEPEEPIELIEPEEPMAQPEEPDDPPMDQPDVDVHASDADSPMQPSDGPSYESGGMFGIGLVVGLKAGGGFSQIFSELGSSFVGELELGYNLPFLDRSLGIYVTGSYSGPTTEGKAAADPRLPGDGIVSYSVTQHQAIIGLGLIYRIPIPLDIFRPYVSAGGRVYLMRADASGSVGDPSEAFGENSETATVFGFSGALGGELYLGPGAVLLEVQVGYASVDSFIFRNTNVGALNVAVGYRIFL